MNLIGFDIGGTKCAVIYGKGDRDSTEIIDKVKVPTDHNISPQEMTELLINEAEKHHFPSPDRVGVSCGGPLSSKDGIIIRPPNLPRWINFNICEYLGKHYNVPVKLQNDANACALAEWRLGSGKGSQNMIFLTFGTGMGAGLILDGKLYTGTNDFAGECGHLRLAGTGPVGFGKKGSFEGFCSGGGLAQLAQKYGFEGEFTAKAVAEAAYKGDKTAIKIYNKCGEMLGRGLSVLIDIINPEVIVIGSIYQRSSSLLIPSMEKIIKKEAIPEALEVCKILPATLGDNIGDYAALITACI